MQVFFLPTLYVFAKDSYLSKIPLQKNTKYVKIDTDVYLRVFKSVFGLWISTESPYPYRDKEMEIA